MLNNVSIFCLLKVQRYNIILIKKTFLCRFVQFAFKKHFWDNLIHIS